MFETIGCGMDMGVVENGEEEDILHLFLTFSCQRLAEMRQVFVTS